MCHWRKEERYCGDLRLKLRCELLVNCGCVVSRPRPVLDNESNTADNLLRGL